MRESDLLAHIRDRSTDLHGLGALGGFIIPPVMGWFVEAQGDGGYANGFIVFVALSIISLGLVFFLKQTEGGANA